MRLLINPLYPNDDYSCHCPLLTIGALYPATTECVVITCNRKLNKAQGLSLEIALEVCSLDPVVEIWNVVTD